MSNKLKKKKPATSHNNQQDSVFKEAWENMNERHVQVYARIHH